MNILHVIPDLSFETGGPVVAVLSMAGALAKTGSKETIASTNYGLHGRADIPGVTVRMYPCQFSAWRWSRELCRALPDLIEESDIVHIDTMWQYPTFAASRACRKRGKPYILRPCGMLDNWSLSQSAFKKKLYLKLLGNRIIADAAAIHFTTREEMLRSPVASSYGKSFIVPNGLSDAMFTPPRGLNSFLAKHPDLCDKRIVLFLGRLHYKKQPDVAIKAFRRVCGMDDALMLVLAGPAERSYLDTLKRLAAKYELGGRVLFTGLLHGENARDAYYAAEMFILPSLQENFGISVAEAMAAQCPVIVSEQVNLASEVRAANAGIVCGSDAQSVAAAMEQLVRDRAFGKKMGKNGRELAMRYSWDRTATSIVAVYQDVLSSNRRSSAWSQQGRPSALGGT